MEGNYNGTSSRYVTPVDGVRRQFPNASVTVTPGTTFLRYPVTIPSTAYRTEGGVAGLTAVYFSNRHFAGTPVATRVEAQLGASPGSGMFGANRVPEAVGTGDFSARWTGILKADETSRHTLAVSGTGAVRVWLEGTLVIDDWNERPSAGRFGPVDPAAAAARSTVVTLEKGKDYALKVEFFRTAQPAPPAGSPGTGFGRLFGLMGPTLSWRAGVTDIKDAVAAARQADVVIAVVGFTREIEGEEMFGRALPEGFVGGDRTSLDLPKDEQALLEAVKALGKPLVVVLLNGSAISANWAHQHANAILEAWYPGEEGGTAIAETLAGANNPAGRLPVTFYKSVKDLPPFEDYSMKGRTYRYFEGQPLYPFGYGLSYSTFAYANARLSTSTLQAGSELQVDVDVRNTSRVAGDEVVQAYLVFPTLPGAPAASAARLPAGEHPSRPDAARAPDADSARLEHGERRRRAAGGGWRVQAVCGRRPARNRRDWHRAVAADRRRAEAAEVTAFNGAFGDAESFNRMVHFRLSDRDDGHRLRRECQGEPIILHLRREWLRRHGIRRLERVHGVDGRGRERLAGRGARAHARRGAP